MASAGRKLRGKIWRAEQAQQSRRRSEGNPDKNCSIRPRRAEPSGRSGGVDKSASERAQEPESAPPKEGVPPGDFSPSGEI